MQSMMSIAIGAVLGALLRWKLGEYFNPSFPPLPLGTLIANLLGSFIIGGFIFFTTEHSFFSYEVRLGVVTGFLGSLTTFSTFSAEALVLFSKQEIFWLMALIFLHVGGSLCMVAAGYALSKLTFQWVGG
ncbi:MAG: fluoride efflux transporter CrcB [Chlamydiales bacterium]|nr:fluoride efflux transporter CrcB [Chlamydiales bacterium]